LRRRIRRLCRANSEIRPPLSPCAGLVLDLHVTLFRQPVDERAYFIGCSSRRAVFFEAPTSLSRVLMGIWIVSRGTPPVPTSSLRGGRSSGPRSERLTTMSERSPRYIAFWRRVSLMGARTRTRSLWRNRAISSAAARCCAFRQFKNMFLFRHLPASEDSRFSLTWASDLAASASCMIYSLRCNVFTSEFLATELAAENWRQ